MKIVSASLQMAAAHAESQQTSVRQTYEAWGNGRRARYELSYTQASGSRSVGAAVQISDAGRQAAAQAEVRRTAQQESVSASAEVTPTSGTDATEGEDSRLDPRMRMLRAVLEALLGRSLRIYGDRPQEASAGQAPVVDQAPVQDGGHGADSGNGRSADPVGLRLDIERTVQESEQLQFQAQGVVHTADGQQIGFAVQLELARSYTSVEGVHVQLGDPPKDPLVINYPGHALELTDTRFSFDLDGDGDQEHISFVNPGSGFLVFDRNGDGQVNNGTELFGTRTGNGFAEIAALDGDGNGWIDENDAAFGQLRLWTKDEDGNNRVQGLLDANIGALSTQSSATPFIFKDAKNAEQGALRASSVFLQEDGMAAGTVAQVDLVA